MKASGDRFLCFRLLNILLLVNAYVMMAARAQDMHESTDSTFLMQEVQPNSVVQQQHHQGAIEEPSDLQHSIDHLLEDAGNANHVFNQEDSGCAYGSHLTELDICLTPAQMVEFEPLPVDAGKNGEAKPSRRKREGSILGFQTWTGATVPYVFNVSFSSSDRNLVLNSMAAWERVTCVRFRPATSSDHDVVVFRDGRRCSTNIGRLGGEQYLTLAQPCRTKRILIHELGHVLGLIHEHQRNDRDRYVRVLLHNVRNSSQERYQFSRLAPRPITDNQVPYSYTSIMHYGRHYFAQRPDLTTLQTMDPHFQDVIGHAELPSYSDADTVNILYGCAGAFQNRLPLNNGIVQNRFPDATCDIVSLAGECNGKNKDTIRSLCSKSCQRYQHQNTLQQNPIWPSPSNTHDSVFVKPHAPQFGMSANVISPPSIQRPYHQPQPQPQQQQQIGPNFNQAWGVMPTPATVVTVMQTNSHPGWTMPQTKPTPSFGHSVSYTHNTGLTSGSQPSPQQERRSFNADDLKRFIANTKNRTSAPFVQYNQSPDQSLTWVQQSRRPPSIARDPNSAHQQTSAWAGSGGSFSGSMMPAMAPESALPETPVRMFPLVVSAGPPLHYYQELTTFSQPVVNRRKTPFTLDSVIPRPERTVAEEVSPLFQFHMQDFSFLSPEG